MLAEKNNNPIKIMYRNQKKFVVLSRFYEIIGTKFNMDFDERKRSKYYK